MSDDQSGKADPKEHEAPPNAPSSRADGSRSGPHLWEIRAVRDVALIAIVIGFFLMLVRIQGAVIPVLVAFILAYVLEPAIAFVERRWEWRRGIVVAAFMLIITAFTSLFTALLAPALIEQIVRLSQRLPRYIEILDERYGVKVPRLREVVTQVASSEPRELASVAQNVFGEAGRIVGTITSVLGTTLSLLTALVLTTVLFAVFALRFPRLPSIKQFLPSSRREALWHRIRQVEEIFAGFFRGQLVVALWTMTAFSVGFALSGVPFWFVASLLGGLFSIVPYGQGVGWVLAVLFGALEKQAGDGEIGWAAVLIGPSIVYVIMQALETLVVTPLVQGSSTRLHPVAVLVAIIAGGGLGGIVGIFFAIPIAATLKIAVLEVAIPRLRQWAENN